MNLLKFVIPFTEKIPEGGKYFSVLAWRTVFSIDLYKDVIFVGTHGEHLSNETNKWHRGAGYHNVSFGFNRKFAFGREHDYYDGPHDSFSLGYLHFNWQGNWCEKCYTGA